MTKKALLLGAALIGAGCSTSMPAGPVGSASLAVSTTAGQPGVIGSANGTGTGATFWYPAGMVYVAPYIYIADSGNSTIRRLNPSTGVVTLFAGYPGIAGYFDNINDSTLYAYFNHPEGITSDGTTYLYVADSGNNVIRRVALSNGLVDTLAGNAAAQEPAFFNGTGTAATFNNPLGICNIGGAGGSLYVADSGNSAIRVITTLNNPLPDKGVVTTLAGAPTSSTFYWPEDVTPIGATDLYVVDAGYDAVFHVTTGGAVTVLAGSGTKGDVDGTSTGAQFNWPEGIATDGTSLYIADTLNSVIRKVTTAGVVTTLAGQGQVFGSYDGTGNTALFNHPMRLVWVGASTSLFVADTYNETIRLVK